MRLSTSAVRLGFVITCACLVWLTAGAATARAGVVTIVSQGSFVDVTAPGLDGGPAREQKQQSTGLGGFTGNVSIVDPQFGLLATATQNSDITVTADGGATITSTGAAVVNNITQSSRPESFFQVVFDVTGAATYKLTYDQSNSARFTPTTASFQGPSGLGLLPPGVPGGFTGDLAAGRYTLSADTSSGSSFDLRLAVTPAASAVPLPPAVWTGLITMALLSAAYGAAKSSRRRAAQ
jgi:hypothetical protein